LAHQHYRLRPGVYAILPIKRRFLLTAQVTSRVDVQLPGGGIDAGESPLQALHREVLEEIGWRIATPLRLGAFRRFVYMPEYDLWAEKLCHVYVAHPVRQISEPVEPDHITLVMSGKDTVDALGNEGDSMFMRRFIG
jgi:8-oxo-dGTP diphosphatase